MTPLQFCFLLSLLCAQCWGFFSDYKLCGDPGCETLLGRVQATKDFKGPDCRFLNFRSGDAIFVYFKLSGKREDLWAGSIDKQFGYFPKDAVEVEEVYTPKEKEIELPTQELDFFCIDENGAIIEGDFSQSDNLDEQVELQGLLADDMQGLRTSEPIQVTQSTKTVDKVETSQTIVQDPFDNAKSKPTEQGGSYWIGSGLTGWLGLGAKNEEQESFKNRKIALDVNQLEENERTETASWLRGQLAGVFSFGQRSPDTAPKEPINQIKDEGLTENPKDEGLTENPKDEGSMANQKETTNTDSWLYTGIGDLLHFHQSVDENSELRIEDSGHPGTEEKIVTENPLSFSEPGERWNEGKKRENSRVEFTDGTKGFSSIENNGYDNDYKNGKPQNDGENDGYGSMYSSVLELYGEKREVENADDNSPGSFEGSHVQEPGSDTRDGSQHETTKDVQSLFSIGGISTMFGSLPSKFQQNIRDVNKDAENYDESALEMTDKGKDVLLELQTSNSNPSSNNIKQENIDKDDNKPYTILSSTGDTNDHHITQLIPQETLAAEDIQLADGTSKAGLGSADQLKISDVIEDLIGDIDMNSSQPIESNEKYNADINDKTASSTVINSSGQVDINSTLQVPMDLNNVDSVMSGNVSVEYAVDYISKMDVSKEDKKTTVVHNKGHDTKTTQNPVASYSKSVHSERGDKSALIDSTEVPSVTSRGEGLSVMDVVKGASLIGSGPESSVIDDPNIDNGLSVDETVINIGGRLSIYDSAESSLMSTEIADSSGGLSVIDSEESNIGNAELSVVDDIEESTFEDAELSVVDSREMSSLGDAEPFVFVSGMQSALGDSEATVVDGMEESNLGDSDPSIMDSREQSPMGDIEPSVADGAEESTLRDTELSVIDNREESVMGDAKPSVIDTRGEATLGETETSVVDAREESTLGVTEPTVVESGEEYMVFVNSEGPSVANNRNKLIVNDNGEETFITDSGNESAIDDIAAQGPSIVDSGDKYAVFENGEAPSVIDSGSELSGMKTEPELLVVDKLSLIEVVGTSPVFDNEEIPSVTEKEKGSLVVDSEERSSVSQNVEEIFAIISDQTESAAIADVSVTEENKETIALNQMSIQDPPSFKHYSTEGQHEINLASYEKEDQDNIWENQAEIQEKVDTINSVTADTLVTETLQPKEDACISENEERPPDPFTTPEQEETGQQGRESKDTGSCSKVVNNEHFGGTEDWKGNKAGDIRSSTHIQEDSGSGTLHTAELDYYSLQTESSFSSGTTGMVTDDGSGKHAGILRAEPAEGVTETPKPKESANKKHGVVVVQPNGNPQSTKDAVKFPEHLKDYRNIQNYMTNQDLHQVLDLIGKHKLMWLDYQLANLRDWEAVENTDDDLAILSDFERLLQYHIEITSTSKGSQADGDTKEASLQKLKALLSTLKSTFTQEKPTVPKHSNQAVTDGPECTHGSCFVPEEDAAEKDRRRFEEGDLLPTVQEETPLQSQSEDLHDGTAAAVALFLNRTSQVILDTTECLQDTVSRLTQFIIQVVSSLPDDLKPGPDFYGLPWEAVIVTALLGMLTMLLFTCRLYQSIKSRFYVGKERKLGQKIAELLEEKCKALETLSQCSHRYEELETALQNGGASAQASEGEDLEAMSKKLEEANAKLGEETEQLKVDLKAQKFKRLQQEETLASMQETLKSLEEESKNLKSQMEQAQTTLKIYDINGERLQKSLQAAKEENVQLLESKAQLVQEAEGWGERLSELEEEMKMCESSHKDMVEQCTSKDQHIQSLTDCLLKMRDWDSEIEDGSVQENGDASDIRQKQKVEKLISAAKVSADLKSLEEEKNRLVARLTDEVKAKEDLQGGIERLQGEKDSLQAESVMFANETQKLQKKLQIMTEMYQENELKLHRMLTVEGRERLQKEEKLSKADKKISLAAEELSTYRQRAQELEEELEKTNQAYKNQIAAHEKKAHDNWLAARAADRDLADVKRENGHLRQKLTDLQFKLEMVEKDPFALEAPGRSSFRGERSPFGPSPLGRPASETRAFLSPPTLMDGPPRLSPQFPLGPGSRGYLYPDPRLPYRRPPPPGAFLPGPLPPRGPALAEAHFNPNPTDKSAELGSTSGSLRLGLSESRDSLLSLSGEPSNAPDANTREAPPLGPPPPLAPVDLLHRRGPYGPPEFFPPRVPPMGMRGPLPPGMYPRFPPLPPHPTGYPPAGPPPDNRSGPPRRPSPPGSEHPPDNRPFSQDMI
ncbi:transport and Golgi organization protein 1 homolog isoform X2 [Brienomyrus brachyistius]|uniref:transport and Golgi organization protein 1 homolog isoform X2 n=1 Tax=Brienomyrus brachyistius TaxID=42636 RepID=UPI0020B40F1D|nr:transport and Golgi organization protein 1 homolog isoform X2 [Brienomyrus brachyistius]